MTLKQEYESWMAHREPGAARILTVDIETAPHTAYVWSTFKQTIAPSQIIEPSRILSVAAKWSDSKRVIVLSEHTDGHDTMIQESWNLFHAADVVVTYNGIRFDILHLQREWLQAGLGKPSPWFDVDLLAEVRRSFKFASNRLGYVTSALELPSKLDTGGFDLWRRVLAGDEKAWRLFLRYNRQDVVITEQLFRLLLPWIRTPHAGQFTLNMQGCPSCGEAVSFAGTTKQRALTYPLVVCGSCGVYAKVLRSGQTRAV